MMNRNDKLEIAKRLRHATEMEMSRHDLEQLLEAELAKPEAEMDAELVQQILEELEEAPAEDAQREAWQKIDKRLSAKRRWQPALVGLVRIAAVCVLVVAMLFATYGTAQALNWEFLLRLMRPFAETFMIYSGDDPTPTQAPAVSEVYGDAVNDLTQAQFTTLADCPDAIAGYPAKPAWMPERFTYAQGSMYTDMQVTSVSHVFKSEDGTCIVDIAVMTDSNDIDSYLFEQVPDGTMSTTAGGYQVTFYRNTQNANLTASWVDQTAHYCITGPVSEEEIILILESMMK